MASAAPTSTATASTSTAAPSKPTTTATTNPHLLPLQEDDEFEEFPAEDWDQKDSYGAHLAAKAGAQGNGQGATTTTGGGGEGSKALDSLWEDDWDDDDVADDFSVQLRGELLKQQEQMQT
ncbi:hypothetical protein JCM8115_001498 [Rhodotorula mucilaginosa]|uniref:26S proteasome complex subunit SEM1 n=1 Tax=Rhodotorula mucilaginosa TaxID=5537 RepID=A0A9P6VSN1_RHOMI|nr:hypothetical protein C6P46_002339 [Rhodotorula mucilaginosa]TKA51355.1 hypothetical protein B0A53_05286 [Rhodotorula sp. CCFEE 5036]